MLTRQPQVARRPSTASRQVNRVLRPRHRQVRGASLRQAACCDSKVLIDPDPKREDAAFHPDGNCTQKDDESLRNSEHGLFLRNKHWFSVPAMGQLHRRFRQHSQACSRFRQHSRCQFYRFRRHSRRRIWNSSPDSSNGLNRCRALLLRPRWQPPAQPTVPWQQQRRQRFQPLPRLRPRPLQVQHRTRSPLFATSITRFSRSSVLGRRT